MAMHASMTQDQNFSVHFDGGVKANGSTVQKNKGGLRARKALNDISNSKNVIPIGEDLGVPKKAQIGGKPQISGKKPQVKNGRKALVDLTNSVKPFAQQHGLKKMGPEKKPITVAEYEDENLPYAVAQECFLHNHEECIKSKKTERDLHQFLRTIGLDEDVSCQTVSACKNLLPRKSKVKDEDLIIMELEEIPMPIIEDRSRQYQCSPIFGSPNSPRLSYMKDWDDIPIFILADTP